MAPADSYQARARMRSFRLWLLPVGGALFAATACGHPATERECEDIVERVAKLELERAHAEPQTVADEVRLAKESFKKDIGRRCLGRRVTQAAMECVRKATSAQQIEDDCFR